MNNIILVRYGEIALKGHNQKIFEDKLISQIKSSIYKLCKFKIYRSQSRIYVEPLSDVDYYELINIMKKIFGIVSLSIVERVESKFEDICKKALEQSNRLFSEGKTSFKVKCKRGDKKFELNSLELGREIGGFILENNPNLTVDLHNPDFTIFVEVREYSYIYSEIIPAQGGLPTGTNGKVTLLLSGGIDSPVAGYMMAKRGTILDAVHFHSYPFTSERAKEKVIELTKILAKYCGCINLFVVPFTDI